MSATATADLARNLRERAQQQERAARPGGQAPDEEQRRELSPASAAYLKVRDMIEKQKAELAQALPQHVSADRLARVALTTLRQQPELLRCSTQSLLGAVMLSAQLGLEPGPLGHVYYVPFRNKRTNTYEVTFIVGYKGLLDLMWRSGKLQSIAVREVCEHDRFEFAYGLEEKLVHVPALTNRGKSIAYYGIAHLKDGAHYMLVMSRDDIERIRRRSKAADDGPWVTDYDAMARKTVLRQMARWLPMSIEVQRAIEADEGATGLDQGEPTVSFEGALDTFASSPADVGDEPTADTGSDQAPEDDPEQAESDGQASLFEGA